MTSHDLHEDSQDDLSDEHFGIFGIHTSSILIWIQSGSKFFNIPCKIPVSSQNITCSFRLIQLVSSLVFNVPFQHKYMAISGMKGGMKGWVESYPYPV